MATRYQFVDDSGETRLAGTLVPDPAVFTPVRNVGQCLYSAVGEPITLATATPVTIPWEVNQGQAGLLNISTATAPTPVADGVYAVSVTMSLTPDSPDDPWYLQLQMDLDWFGQAVTASGVSSGSADLLAVSQTWFCSVGSALSVTVRGEGSGILTGGFMYVQRIT